MKPSGSRRPSRTIEEQTMTTSHGHRAHLTAVAIGIIAGMAALLPAAGVAAADDPLRLAQATQRPIDVRPKSDQPATKSTTMTDTAVKSEKKPRTRGRIPDLTTLCEVPPPCPVGCREDIKRNACVDSPVP
jgi:hypothetical protein